MAYQTGYFTVKNILSDFINIICFNSSTQGSENWQLVYPRTNDFNEAKTIIDTERRVTISTTFIPKKSWEKKIIELSPTFIGAQPEEIELVLDKTIATNAATKVYIKDSNYIFYRTIDEIQNQSDVSEDEKIKLNNLEYSVSYEKNCIIINKNNFLSEDNIYLIIEYQTNEANAITWFVDFDCPKLDETGQTNYSYFQWTFGKKIDKKTYHVVNDKVEPQVIRSYWHSPANKDTFIGEWLPINYFISWDLYSIAFVFCEEPISNINKIQHGFNYIGVLDNIEGADYDDINYNFGSCGSVDSHWEDAIPKGKIEIEKGIDNANFTFRKVFYDGKFEPVSNETILRFNDVPLANYLIGNIYEGDYNLLNNQAQEVISSSAYPFSNSIYPSPNEYFEGNIISRPYITQTYAEPIFIIPKNTAVVKKNENVSVTYVLKEDAEMKFSYDEEHAYSIASSPTDCIYFDEDVDVIDKATSNRVTLPRFTQFYIGSYYGYMLNQVVYTDSKGYEFKQEIKFNTGVNNTYYVDIITSNDKHVYTLITDYPYSVRPTIINMRGNSHSNFILNGNFKTTNTSNGMNDILYTDDIVHINGIDNVKFKITRNIIVDYQYKEPYTGNINVYIATTGYDGKIKGKTTGFNSSEERLLEKPEELRENSKFLVSTKMSEEGELTIKDGQETETINIVPDGMLDNDLPIIGISAIVSTSNHKCILDFPELITTPIGQQFEYIYTQIGAKEVLERPYEECTVTYPNQIYDRCLHYKKVITPKLYFKLNDGGTKEGLVHDAVRVVFLTSADGVRYKPILNWKQNGTYKNITIEYEQTEDNLFINFTKTSTDINYDDIIIGYYWCKEALSVVNGIVDGRYASFKIGNRYLQDFKDIIVDGDFKVFNGCTHKTPERARKAHYPEMKVLTDSEYDNFTTDTLFYRSDIIELGTIKSNERSATFNSKNYTRFTLSKVF